MWNERSITEQVFNGIFIAGWLVTRPFVWIWKFLIAIFKETHSRMIKIIGGVLAIAIVGHMIQLLTQ